MLKKLSILITLATMALANVNAYANTASLEQTILNGVKAHQDEIDISTLNVDPQSAVDAYLSLKNTEADLFCVDNAVNCTFSGNTAKALVVNYVVDKNEIDSQKSAIDSQVAKVVAIANEGKTDVEKAQLAHDYFVNNTEYDYSMTSDSVYDLLVNNKGICISYAQAYKMVMNELGIECEISISNAMAHAWNVVKIDGNWYNVDVTYDVTGGVNSNFLKSDKLFTTIGHYDWVNENGVTCTDTKFDSML